MKDCQTTLFLQPFYRAAVWESRNSHCSRTSGNWTAKFAKPLMKRASLYMNVSASIDSAPGTVKVHFIPDDIMVMASPGELLSDVARRAGVEIIESCGVGDCGTCEVLLRDQGSGDGFYIKSCVAKVPAHKDLLVIDTVGDAIPPW